MLDEHLAILKQGIEQWNQWRIDHPDIQPDLKYDNDNFIGTNLSKFNFSGCDLSWVRFWGTNLSRVNFSRANLYGCDFSQANLNEVNFEGAILEYANLGHTNLGEFDFSGCDLSWVRFGGTNLSQVNFSRANLSNCDFSRANLSEVNFEGAILKNADFSHTDLSGFDFSGFDLSGVKFCRANLSEVNFEGAILKNADFSHTDLSGFDFSGFDLSGVKFCGTNLSKVNFSQANLSYCDFSFSLYDLAPIIETRADLDYKYSNIAIRNIFTNYILQITANLEKANLERANLQEANLQGTNLKNTNLKMVNFKNAKLSEAQFEGANIEKTTFKKSDFSRFFVKEIKRYLSKIPVPSSASVDDYPALLLRYTNIECPDNTIINSPFSIYVRLLLERPNLNTDSIEIENTNISKLPEIEVVLRSPGFEIRGSNTKVIEVESKKDTEQRFVLIPHQLGEQEIRVDFYQNERRIGTARRNIIIYSEEESNKIKTPHPQNQPILEIKNKFLVPPPDLELCIQLDNSDQPILYFTLHSTKSEIDFHHKIVGQVTLPSSLKHKMQSVYQELNSFAEQVDRKLESIDDRESFEFFLQNNQKKAEERLISIGNQLWDELIPDELKQQYWQFKSVIKSLLITSDEPWIPWETIKPYRFNNGKEEQEPFWCEQFAMSRWLSGPGTADNCPAKLVITVAPNKTNLSCLQQEVAFFQSLNSLCSSIYCLPTISNVLELKNCIQKLDFSILHFACHGMFDSTLPNDSAIHLSDGVLRPSDLLLNFSNLRPIVFINACHGGRVGFSFTKIGGWAEKFVKARVGVFIGAMWEVNDELACQFAQIFYTALLRDNLTVAQAFQKSRQAIREASPYNSTWLAYTLYADPEARIQQIELDKHDNY
jgi:uncharacterized protein YjbI with pentapeptide repeats